MRKLIPLLLSIVLILASCELFTDEPVAGDVYAIMVGLDYQNNSQRDLYGTINDANELDLAFKSVTQQTGKAYFGYKFLQIGSSFVSSTTHTIGSKSVNSYPSLSNLKEAIAALKDITQKDDLILFTYSGHGNDDGTIALGSSSYSDAALSPVQEILDSFVDNDIKGRKLIILDTCYSGVSLPDSPGSSNTVLGSSIDDWYAKYWDNTLYELPDLFVLTASADTESYEDEFNKEATVGTKHNHGLFTAALLEALGWRHPHATDITTVVLGNPPALRGSALSVDSIYSYVFNYIEKHPDYNPQWSIFKLNETTQHPLVSGGAMDMVLFRF